MAKKKVDLMKDKKGTVHLDENLPMSEESVSHKFADYLMKGDNLENIKEKVSSQYNPNDPKHAKKFDKERKKEYDKWVAVHWIPPKLRKSAWEHYIND